MDIITPRKLQALSTEKQRLFEGLLPELIKKLIISTCSTDNLRIPHGDDIWAHGFDGLIYNSTKTEYVDYGYSVWEFGTNGNAIKKINDDYAKRTQDDLGVDKKETVFYLVVPKIWNYSPAIPEWEKAHTDWKKTIIYDASRLCDWINSEPTIAAWLLEKYYNQPANFQTVDKAWELFSQKTSPSMTASLFLLDRKEELDQFYASLQSEIIRVKADTFIEAQGFVLTALMNRTPLASQSIVVNDEGTYRLISSFVKSKLIVLNYACSHDLVTANNNRTIVCYNKEDTGIHEGIRINPLLKYHYIRAFKDMGISDAEAHELYSSSHGNLRTLIRRIPGTASDKKPEWANVEDINLLAPLLFMRKINCSSRVDRKLAEMLTGKPFDNIEEKYQELRRLEDSPIKVVEDYYIIVNYEETWDTLGYTINGKQYKRLTDTVLCFLDSLEKNGNFEDYTVSSYGRLSVFHALMFNYIYFSMDDPESDTLHKTTIEILQYLHKPRAGILCLQNLSLLAEIFPCEVIHFLKADMDSPSGLVYSLFDNRDHDGGYLEVLFALDELTHHTQSAASACRLLLRLCQKEYVFKSSNSPEDSLITALCFINTSVAMELQQKVELIKRLYKDDPGHMSDIIIKVAQKDSCYISCRPGKKKVKKQQSIIISEYYQAIEDISADVLYAAIRDGQTKRIIHFFDMYYRFTPAFLLKSAAFISKEVFSFEDLSELNYSARKKRYEIKRYGMKRDSSYIKSLDAWIKATTDGRCPFHWLFHNYYDCPDDRLANGTNDYETRDKKKLEIRGEALQEIISENGIEGVSTLIGFMEDIHLWGYFLSDNLPPDYLETITLQLSVNGKLAIVGAILDSADKTIFTKVYTTLSPEQRVRLFVCMKRADIDDLLISEEDRRQYWQKKTLFQFDDKAYTKLLRYYPAGLLRFCYETIRHDPPNHMDMVSEVLNAILASGYKTSSFEQMEDYELKQMMNAIDKEYYTDEWGKLSKDLFVQGVLSELTDGGGRYFIYHPDELIALVNTKKDQYYYISRHFSLPFCVYNEHDKLRTFAKVLVMENQAFLLGDILGLSMPGADGFFPHDIIRELLEEINNDDVDRNIVVTYINNQNAHTVTDGSELKEKAYSFFEMADRLEISYHHTAAILRSIGQDYMRESKWDYLYSEIESI